MPIKIITDISFRNYVTDRNDSSNPGTVPVTKQVLVFLGVVELLKQEHG
jgi:hypothetical protein